MSLDDSSSRVWVVVETKYRFGVELDPMAGSQAAHMIVGHAVSELSGEGGVAAHRERTGLLDLGRDGCE